MTVECKNLSTAPSVLNTNDKAMWALGWNECLEAHLAMEPNTQNRRIRDSVDSLLAQAGYAEDSSARNQLSCMNFDTDTASVQKVMQEVLQALAKLTARCSEVKAALDKGIPDGEPVHPQSTALTFPTATALGVVEKLELYCHEGRNELPQG